MKNKVLSEFSRSAVFVFLSFIFLLVFSSQTSPLMNYYGGDSAMFILLGKMFNLGLPTGRILKKGSNVIQNFGYKFDAQTGNLLWRKDNVRGIQENFTYDHLNRLTSYGNTKLQYNNQGNVIDHSDLGYLGYNKSKPYAVEVVQPYTNNLPKHNQDITYSALMRPTSISENGYRASLTYNADGDRVKMNLVHNNSLQLNRYYIGGIYEIDETLAGKTERLYLGGDPYSAAAVYVKENGKWDINYIGRDYLGSITHVIDATGVVKQELSYDPWGRFRDPVTQALYDLDRRLTLVLGNRGYTGHEHLPEFGLINMNARLYDPVVGRFLSPDPYVQAPDFSQNFNRYSYALNNPLRYTDPNGEFLHIVIGAVAGGIINLGYKALSGQINSWGDGFAAFGIGALAGSIGATTGGATFFAAGGSAAGAGGFIAGMWGWNCRLYGCNSNREHRKPCLFWRPIDVYNGLRERNRILWFNRRYQ